MIFVDLQHYSDYLINSLRIFVLTFILGRGINHLFVIINKKYPNYNKKLFGFLQLFFIINVAYVFHIFTTDEFSDEFQITHPGILFSSFMISLQTNMFKNLGVF